MLPWLVVGLLALALGCQNAPAPAPDAAAADVPVTRVVLIDGLIPNADPVVLADPAPVAHARVASPSRAIPCGGLDRHTGLLMPCFDAPVAPSPRRHHGASAARSARCGHTDPRTGLIIPCFH